MLPAFGNSQDLRDIEERLAQAPDDVGLLFSRACVLDMLGRSNSARDAYIEVIKRDGKHLGALTNLGTLLFNAGYRSAARLTYQEALKHHPDDVPALINYGNALLEAQELDAARQTYERAIARDADSAQAHQGLSHVLERWGWKKKQSDIASSASRRCRSWCAHFAAKVCRFRCCCSRRRFAGTCRLTCRSMTTRS